MAYRLTLPAGARLHDVFHVGLLKPFVGTPPTSPPALPPTQHGGVLPVLASVLKSRMVRGVRQLLVRWDRFASVCDFMERSRFLSFSLPCFPARGRAACRGGEGCYVGINVQEKGTEGEAGAGAVRLHTIWIR